VRRVILKVLEDEHVIVLFLRSQLCKLDLLRLCVRSLLVRCGLGVLVERSDTEVFI